MLERANPDHVVINIRELEELASRQALLSASSSLVQPADEGQAVSLASLDGLANEMLIEILKYLPMQSISRLSRVNSQFHAKCLAFLANDVLSRHLRPEISRLKIGFFRRQQGHLNDDIEALQETKTGCQQISTELGIGTAVTILLGYLDHLISQSAASSRDLKIFMGIFFLIGLSVFLKGMYDMVKTCRTSCEISQMNRQIENYNHEIASHYPAP